MPNVPSSTPQINFSLPASLHEAVTELRKRVVEAHALAGAVAEKLSSIPGTTKEAQALADVAEEIAGDAVSDIDRICAALDAVTT